MGLSPYQHSAGPTRGSTRGRGYYPVPQGVSHPYDVKCRRCPTDCPRLFVRGAKKPARRVERSRFGKMLGPRFAAAPIMKYADLRDFVAQLEHRGELKRIAAEVDPRLEMTEICDRVLRAGGPAILFETPKGSGDGSAGGQRIPVLANLFGTPARVALGMGEESVTALREVGKLLAFLKEPEPPKGLMDAWQNTRPLFMQVMQMAPKERKSAPCQEVVW